MRDDVLSGVVPGEPFGELVARQDGVLTRQVIRQRRGGRWYDDVHYRQYRTRVELDGRAAHPDQARLRERHRDNAAAADGETVLHYGWPEVTDDPCACAIQVAAVLRRHGWTGEPVPCWPGCPVARS